MVFKLFKLILKDKNSEHLIINASNKVSELIFSHFE